MSIPRDYCVPYDPDGIPNEQRGAAHRKQLTINITKMNQVINLAE